MHLRLVRVYGVCLALLALILAAGCQETGSSGPDGGGGEAGNAGAAGAGTADGPLYVFATQSLSDTTSSVAFSFHDSIDDLDPDTLLEDARTFDNGAGFEVIDGRLYVSSGDAPEITAYEITDDREWIEGDTVSFAAYGFTDNANWHNHYILGSDRVMLPFDAFSRIIWDPAAMRIVEDLDDASLELETDG